ncbi:hypothetical protein K8R30_01985 [archaeon]|nr:hypothetical protein [archaeon]
MKRFYIILIVIGALMVVSSGSFVLMQVFWSSNEYQTGMESEEANGIKDEGRVEINIGDPAVEDSFGGGGAGGGGSGSGDEGDSGVVDDGCILRQVQYSLKNFGDDVLCLENGSVGCSKIKVNCFVEVYNFDVGVDDIFGVRYSLVDSNEDELDFKLVEGDVATGSSKIFSAEFIWEDEDGVGENLNCVFGMERIPNKKIC